MRGLARTRASDPLAAERLARWLRRLRGDYADRNLRVTDVIAAEWGRLPAVRPRGDVDGLIAATAFVHDLMRLTRNTRDFADAGVPLIDPLGNRAVKRHNEGGASKYKTSISPRLLVLLHLKNGRF